MVMLYNIFNHQQGYQKEIGYSEFLAMVESKNVKHVNIQGKNLIVTNFNGEEPSVIVDVLIQNNVTFVYHSDCSYCKLQIAYFNESWDKYVDSGLTVDCK